MHLVKLPHAEENMISGTVRKWLKAKSDRIEKGDLLVTVETETCLLELESSLSGTLEEILVPEGQTAAVGETLAGIADLKGIDTKNATPDIAKNNKESDETMSPPSETAGEVIPILMPQAGQSMEEGTILKWHIQPGDRIEKGQIIFDVETDKATIEVEADNAGRLARIVVGEDETVPVKVPVAYLAENDSDLDAWLAAHPADESETEAASGVADVAAPSGEPTAAAALPADSTTASAAAPTVALAGGRAKASPAARKLAAEKGIDLLALPAGSGPGGRILSTDVEAAPLSETEPLRRPMSPMRKAIAKNLLISKQTIPHFYMRHTIDAGPMLDFYQAKKAGGTQCSLNDLIVAACARTIREFPPFRSRIEGNDLIEIPTANIGIAVGVVDGLVVPVLVGADRMTFEQIAAGTRRIIDAARQGKLEGVGQGVFTITNLGMFGIEDFSAIINPPEAAILAVSAIREDVVVRDGAIRAGKVMTMTASLDHRVIDGLVAAEFLARLKEILENPSESL